MFLNICDWTRQKIGVIISVSLFFILLISLIATIYVYIDAKKRDLSNNKLSKSPIEWAIGVFLLCAIFFPLYLATRGPVTQFDYSGTLASFEYDTELSRQDLLSKASSHLKAVGYGVVIKDNLLVATNGKVYNTLIAAVSFLFFLIPFFIYWFTRTRNKIVIDASIQGHFEIKYKGSKAASEAERLSHMFKK